MSIIAAGTTTTTALSSTGNTDGTLQLQVNGTTPSVTLNTLGAIGVGSSPNYGTSGQALVSAGSTAAPTWANVTTSPAGSNTQIQYNNSGSFGASSNLTWNGSALAVTGAISATGGISGTAGANISGAGWGVLPYVANSLVLDNNAGESRFFATGANSTTDGSFLFYTGQTDGGANERFRIGTAGQLGIGGANYGTSGQVLTSGGSGAAPSWSTVTAGYTLGTPVATTSGTTIDFTGFPSGTKQIIITFAGVSTDGTSVKIIQIGDSGGIETSGYSDNSVLLRNNAAVLIDSRAAGYSIHSDAAGDLLRGSVTLTLQSSSTNTWVAEGGLFLTGSRACVLAGSKSLTSELTSVRITADNGIDSFDAGSINIAYI